MAELTDGGAAAASVSASLAAVLTEGGGTAAVACASPAIVLTDGHNLTPPVSRLSLESGWQHLTHLRPLSSLPVPGRASDACASLLELLFI